MTTAVRQRMTHRAAVTRLATIDDRYDVPSFSAHLAALPCWLYVRGSRGEDVNAERTAVIDDLRLLVPKGTDIKTTDRITSVTDRLSASILAGPIGITSILPHHDHLELQLQRVSGGA